MGSTEHVIQLEAARLHKRWIRQWGHQLIQADVDALLIEDRLLAFTHVWTPEHGYTRDPSKPHPTAAEVNRWSLNGLGHDDLNRLICVEARCAREGVPFLCVRCDGTADIWPSAEIKQRYETWQPEEPPIGDGYQLWETNAQAPISPVFTTIDSLSTWCAAHATTFGSYRASANEWREMLEADFVHAKEGRALLR